MKIIFAQHLRLLIAIVLLLLFSCAEKSGEHQSSPKIYSRIISCAPSVTETLFALSLGEKVVGVSSFCKYPPEVEKIQKVGGYSNPNFEMILRLKPDLVILLQEHAQMLKFLKKKGIDYLLIDNHDLSSIFESFRIIGKKCGKLKEADELVQRILSEIPGKGMDTGIPPKVLLCVERENQGSGKIYRAYIAGESTFYHDLLKMACMSNAASGFKMAYPQIAVEGIITMQPDIIIDITMRSTKIAPDRMKADWQSVKIAPAVKNNMVFCLSGDYLTVPGPRILMLLRDFKNILTVYRQTDIVQ